MHIYINPYIFSSAATTSSQYTTNGLLHYYDFANAGWGSGTTVKDLQGTVDLTINAPSGSSVQSSPPCLVCPNSSFTTYLQNTNAFTTVSGLTAISIEVLFMAYSGSGAQYTVNLGYGVNGGVLCMNGCYDCLQQSGQFINSTTNSTVLLSPSWSHAIFVFGAGAGACKIYLNGVAQAFSTTGTMTTPFSISQMNFGQLNQGIYGKFAMARIYNRALTTTEILANYASAKAGGSYGI